MARLFFFVFLAAFGGVASFANHSRAPALVEPDRLRVVTYNVQHGEDAGGRYDLSRTARTLAAIDADLIGVQEVVRNHADYDCDDQPALIAEGLRVRTGRPWQHVYVKEWNTKKRQCLEDGRGDEWETEGLAFFAPEPFAAVEHVRLWNGRIGLMVRLASMPVPVIVTHLASGAGNRGDRIRQIERLLPWADTHGPGILMGDLNGERNADELAPLRARYQDAWVEAATRGRANGPPSGSTRPGRDARIDYVLYGSATPLRLESVDVVDTSTILRRTEASDHRPVVATFRKQPLAGR